MADTAYRARTFGRRVRYCLGRQGPHQARPLSLRISDWRALADRRGGYGMKPGVRRLIEDLRGARVLVIHPRDAEGEALIDQLKRIGCNVRGVWPPPPTIPREIDTVFQLVESTEDTVFPSSSNEHPLTLVAI